MYCRYAKTSIWDNHKQCPLNVEVNSIVSFIGSVPLSALFHYSTIFNGNRCGAVPASDRN